MHCWPEPSAGEIVWCHFPDNISAKPKPRPGLIISVKEDNDAMIFVNVAYGTSQKTNRLYSGEFLIAKFKNPVVYATVGLSDDTKFDLNRLWVVPFIDEYFSIPPHAPHGQIPKLGILHPSMVHVVAAAFNATRSR